MKFDVVIGNPPYQEDTSQSETINGQRPVRNIFQYFQIEADNVTSQYTLMIYPGRWIQRSGKGMKQFGLNQINDRNLKKLVYFPDASEVFQDVGIPDGISIVLKNKKHKGNSFKYCYMLRGKAKKVDIKYPGEKIIPLNPEDYSIVSKIENFVQKYNFDYLHDGIFPRTLFGIESNYVEENPEKVQLYNGGKYDTKKYIKLFANDRAGKAGRSTWYLTTLDNIPENKELVSEWQVTVSSANAGGQKRDNQIAIIDNNSAFARSRLALKSFETKDEAENFFEYATSRFIRYAFLLTDENLSSLAKRVPDICDYKSTTSPIDFTSNIDEQLYSLLGLTEDEIEHIVETLTNLR